MIENWTISITPEGGVFMLSTNGVVATQEQQDEAERVLDSIKAMIGKEDPTGWEKAAQKLKQACKERNHANMMRYALAMDKAEVGE